MLNFFHKKDNDVVKQLADILAQPHNRESLLGTNTIQIPQPEDIRKDAAKISRYSEASDYKVFADEVWSRVLNHLDTILDDKASNERVQYHRGALKATLDLLRLSFQARSLMELQDKEVDAPLPR